MQIGFVKCQLDVETRHALSLRGFGDFYLKNDLKTLEITGYVKSKLGGNYLFVFLKKKLSNTGKVDSDVKFSEETPSVFWVFFDEILCK
jgi:hypothetical protein